jgi:putative transcriptional regulator
MSKANTTTADGGMNWAAFDALTDEEIAAAVARDPDAAPFARSGDAPMRRITLSRFLRHKLSMSQKKFAEAYDIPLATLIAWERHEAEPTAVELAYLRAIERNPDGVRKVPA